MNLLRILRSIGRSNYYYLPERPMVWHPLYDSNTRQGRKCRFMTTEQRRAIRDKMLPDEWTEEVWDESLRFWEYSCAACGGGKDLQRDHLVPVAHRDCPGAVPSNLIPLCRTCNKDKSYHDFALWYTLRFGRYPHTVIDKIHNWQYYCVQQGWN